MSRRLTAFVACSASLAIIASGCAHAPSMAIDLTWRPTSDLDALPPEIWQDLSAHRVRVSLFTVDPDREIGSNVEGEEPRPVTTKSNIGGFVQDHVAELLSNEGIPVVLQAEERVLRGVVTRFYVREDHRYRGMIAVKFILESADGRPLWDGVMVGRSTRWGHSFRAENYQETLSTALVDTVQALLKSSSFREAYAGRASWIAMGATSTALLTVQ